MHVSSSLQSIQIAKKTNQANFDGDGIGAAGPKPEKIDPSSIVRSLSDSEIAAQSKAWAFEPSIPMTYDDLSLQYATLVKNGQTMATVYKDGVMMTPNSVHVPADLVNDGSGKVLADARIKQMLAAIGGEIVYR